MSDKERDEVERRRAKFIVESGILELMEQASRERDADRFRRLVSQAREILRKESKTWPLSLTSVGPKGRGQFVVTSEWQRQYLTPKEQARALPRPPRRAGVVAGLVEGARRTGVPDLPSKATLGVLVKVVRRKLKYALRREIAPQDPLPGHGGPVAHGGSLVEPTGQASITIAALLRDESVITVIGLALEGGLEHVPIAVAREVANDAEKQRRWEGRGGDHADGPPLLEVGLDIEPPESDAPWEDQGARDLRGGRLSGEPAAQEVSERRRREQTLELEADAVLDKAGKLEAVGQRRTAQRLRRGLYEKLGGKKPRTPEVRKRRR